MHFSNNKKIVASEFHEQINKLKDKELFPQQQKTTCQTNTFPSLKTRKTL